MNQRGTSNTRRNQSPQNYDHSNDLVLDNDVPLAEAESNQQPAIIPLELQNHRRTLDNDSEIGTKENGNAHKSSINTVTILNLNENDMKLNNDLQLITTTPKPIYKPNEDALQHENSKLISELKFAGMDLNRLADLSQTLLNTKQSSSSNLNNLNMNLMSKPTDQSILDNLPSLTSHIQRLQNDHLTKVFQNEGLRELALESGLKLNQLNELLPQAQPLIKTGDNSSTIDFDNLLNSVNNLISSSALSSTTTPYAQITSTSTTTQSPPVTDVKDIYLDEESASDDILPPNHLLSTDDLNDHASKSMIENNANQDKTLIENQVNVQVLNHHLMQDQQNQFKHEPLPKNQPSYIIETDPKSSKHHQQQVPVQSNQPTTNNKQPINNKPNKMPPPLTSQTIKKNPHYHHQMPSNMPNNKQTMINYSNGHILHTPNLIQPLINHQHHQPLNFQYLPHAFNQLTLPINALPVNLNSLNALPNFNLLTNPHQLSLILPSTKPPKQSSKLANLFKQNSLTQYGYSLLQSFKKDNNQNLASSSGGLLSLFPTRATRALRVGRNARMQVPNKLNLIKLKSDSTANQAKIRNRRSIGSHVNVQQEFQVVTPLDMQFNDFDDQQLNQPELLQGRTSEEISETKSSLICLEFKSSYFLIASIAALLFLFGLSLLICCFMIRRYKKLEIN